MNFIFATCPTCNGYGKEVFRVTVYEHDCGFPHDDSDERDCSTCDGYGTLETQVEPVTMENLHAADR